jgi:patatin-like phospholipase/acyl hydrolase
MLFASQLFATDKPVRVLSLDGGGIRGIIEAVILVELEKDLNLPIAEIFDLVAGSSTGGIIALGLVKDSGLHRPLYSAKDLLNVYLNHGDQVFHASIYHRIKTLYGFLGPKYESASLKNLLVTYLGDAKLSEALKPTIITGYDVEGEIGVEFSSEQARLFSDTIDCRMCDLALATSAAPIFFDTPCLELSCICLNAVMDGGIYKNNPALLAYLNAKEIYPNRTIEVYSFGTGRIHAENNEKVLNGRGLWHWLPPLIFHKQIGDIEGDNVVLDRILNQSEQRNFFRLDVRIDRAHRRMDNILPENIQYLYEKGQEAVQSDTYKLMVQRLSQN